MPANHRPRLAATRRRRTQPQRLRIGDRVRHNRTDATGTVLDRTYAGDVLVRWDGEAVTVQYDRFEAADKLARLAPPSAPVPWLDTPFVGFSGDWEVRAMPGVPGGVTFRRGARSEAR